jgi:hypothetical protein
LQQGAGRFRGGIFATADLYTFPWRYFFTPGGKKREKGKGALTKSIATEKFSEITQK